MGKFLKITMIIAAFVAVFAGGVLATPWLRGINAPKTVTFDNAWYSVRTAGGQEYYGHIDSVSDLTMKLDDVYYIEEFKVAEPVATSTHYRIESMAPQQSIYNLVHKGDESSSTTDHSLFLNRSAVTTWEKLKPDSQIVALIEKSKNVGK